MMNWKFTLPSVLVSEMVKSTGRVGVEVITDHVAEGVISKE